MEHEEEKTKIDLLEKKLYSRDGKTYLANRKKLPPLSYGVQKQWTPEAEGNAPPAEPPFGNDDAPRMSVFKKIFLISILFFAAALLYALFGYYHNSNSVSSDNIAISVLGPVSVAGGEVLPLDITVENKNNAAIELAALTIEYPDGTKSADNVSADLPRERDEIGDMAGGAKTHIQTKAILFGEEGSTEEIKVEFEYRIAGSNASFDKSTSYLVGISSAPVSITVDSLKEINSGQTLEMTLNVVSNSPSVIKNLLLSADYPFGWSFQSATPAPSSENNVWNLGDLDPQGKRTIKIDGKIEGQDGEERVFKFNAGLAKSEGSSIIGTSFLTASQSVSIQKPFLGLTLSLDGDSSDQYIAESGHTIQGEVDWANNLPDKISDAAVVVKLTGDLINQSSVSADSGFYRSSDNTITWDKSTAGELGSVNPGDSGKLTFHFSLLPLVKNGSSEKNPQFHIDVSGKGSRLSDTNVQEAINALVSRDVKISTGVGLVASALHSIGAFQNSGPIPPKADAETTYTIQWSATNSSNPVSDAKVSAILPPYVKWQTRSLPTSENITFNPVTNEVVWDLASVKSDTGIGNSPREVSFQVSLLPSISQVGTSPTLIGNATFSGTDDFTGGDVGTTAGALSTELVNDPNFQSGQEKVVK